MSNYVIASALLRLLLCYVCKKMKKIYFTKISNLSFTRHQFEQFSEVLNGKTMKILSILNRIDV